VFGAQEPRQLALSLDMTSGIRVLTAELRCATRARLLLPLIVLASAVGLLTSTARADSYYPLLQVDGDAHLLGQVNDLDFNLEYMSSAGQTSSVTIQTPAGFNGSFVQTAGTKLGTADLGVLPAGTNIDAARPASITRYTGSLLVMDATAYASDSNAQACAPGPHRAYWELSLANTASGFLVLPVAVDSSAGGYKLTMCFGALQTAGKEVEYLDLAPDQIFRNPGKHGHYLFDGVVTPLGAGGSPDAGSAYELRSYEVLPQLLTAVPSFDSRTKLLTVTGKSQADGLARRAVDVTIYGAVNANATNWTKLGATQTRDDGSYTFTRKFGLFRYRYVYAGVDDTNAPTCPGTSVQPQGCASISMDGRGSAAVEVTEHA
jgi:hypothetical protein